MGRRGTKPTPTALRVLQGKRYGYNADEPQHAALDLTELPAEIAEHPIARDEWQRVAPGLVASGQITVVERAALIGYCVKYAHWREREQLAKAEPFIVRGSRGVMVHPLVKIADAAFLIFLRAAAEIGLTPSSRSRIIAKPSSAQPSKWNGVLR